MEPLGINAGLLLTQWVVALLVIGFPIISLIDPARKRLAGCRDEKLTQICVPLIR
jgi:hypothetical protein